MVKVAVGASASAVHVAENVALMRAMFVALYAGSVPDGNVGVGSIAGLDEYWPYGVRLMPIIVAAINKTTTPRARIANSHPIRCIRLDDVARR